MQFKSIKEAQPQTSFQLWFVILIVIVGWSRYLPLSHPELYNFTPVLALFFISGAYLRGHLSWIGPVLAVIASDLVLNPNYGMSLFEPFTLISIFAYLGIFFLGKSIRSSKKIFPIFAGALGSALLFHGITCGFALLINPDLFKGKKCNVEIEIKSDLTRGSTVIDWWEVTSRPKNALVINEVDSDGFFELLTERVSNLK